MVKRESILTLLANGAQCTAPHFMNWLHAHKHAVFLKLHCIRVTLHTFEDPFSGLSVKWISMRKRRSGEEVLRQDEGW